MKVFLSWSGERSRQLAEALRDWLPGVLQTIEPWLSSNDPVAGAPWVLSITSALEETRAAIICLTNDNILASWLNFEAGALSRARSGSELYLYALDLEAANDVSGPLGQFRVALADREQTFGLLGALNRSASGPQLSERKLKRAFNLWWPSLESALAAIPPAPVRPGGRQHTRHPADPSAGVLEQKVDKALVLLENLVEHQEAVARPPSIVGGTTAPGRPTPKRPRAFIGSSSEGLPVAEAIQELLDPVAECTIWNQGVFAPGGTFIDSLQDARLMYDFAVIVLTSDDTTTSRGQTAPAPRDNLLFELGLFAGALGRARTFLVLPIDSPPRLPSDLSGVTTTQYRSRSDGNLVAGLGPAVSQIARAMGIARGAV